MLFESDIQMMVHVQKQTLNVKMSKKKKKIFYVRLNNATIKSFITHSIYFIRSVSLQCYYNAAQLYMHTYHQLSDDIVNVAGTLNHMPILWILMDNG